MIYLNIGKLRDLLKDKKIPDEASLCLTDDGKAYQVLIPYNKEEVTKKKEAKEKENA